MSTLSITLTDAEILRWLRPFSEIFAGMRPYKRHGWNIPSYSGVYFLSDGAALVYVGSSIQIDRRLFRHWAVGEKKFDHYFAIEVPPEHIVAVEGFYILLAGTPYYNTRVLPAHYALQAQVDAARDGTLWKE